MMRCRRSSDEGATLVLALIIVLAVGLTIGTLLSFANTGELTTVQYRGQADDVYSSGAGIDGAIAKFVSLGKNGDTDTGTTASGANCGKPAPFLTLSGWRDGQTVTVTCDPTSNSGTGGSAGGGGGTSSANTPENAILTLPPSGETGIQVKSNTSEALKIRGGIFTNGDITLSPGDTLFDCARSDTTCAAPGGKVRAERACDGVVPLTATSTQILTGDLACSNTTPAISDPAATDPGVGDSHYDLPTVADGFDPSQPATSVPTCPASKVVIFQPGNYTDASALTSLMSGGCAGAAFYFSPGYYYFDFANSGSHQWAIGDPNADVIGGKVEDTGATPTIWDPTSANARNNLPSPRQCAGDDLNLLANSGVQFIFGSDSQLYVNADNSMDLCPIVDANRQEISIYGVQSGTTNTGTKTFDTAPVANITTNGTAPKFTNLSNAATIDSSTADATLAQNKTATLNISGWTDTVPAAATVTSASITVARYEENTDTRPANVQLDSSISSSGGSQTLNLAASTVANHQDQNLAIPTNLVDTAAERASLAFQLNATLRGTNSGKEHVDGVRVTISYTVPGLDAESGCVTSSPYPTSGCPLLSTSGNPANITIHGTIYAPNAAIDVQMPNQVAQFFGRGLVARTLVINPTASNPLAQPTFDLPQASSGGTPTSPSPRRVVLTAYVDGVVRLRAFVKFNKADHNCSSVADCNGSNPTVIHWSYVR